MSCRACKRYAWECGGRLNYTSCSNPSGRNPGSDSARRTGSARRSSACSRGRACSRCSARASRSDSTCSLGRYNASGDDCSGRRTASSSYAGECRRACRAVGAGARCLRRSGRSRRAKRRCGIRTANSCYTGECRMARSRRCGCTACRDSACRLGCDNAGDNCRGRGSAASSRCTGECRRADRRCGIRTASRRGAS